MAHTVHAVLWQNFVFMSLLKISDNISYLPATENPLSADVVFIQDDDALWIFDCGRSDEAFLKILKFQDFAKKNNLTVNLVISHFHEDHTDNLIRVTPDFIYAGDFTARHFGWNSVQENSLKTGNNQAKIEIVSEAKSFQNGSVQLIPLVNSHSKGSLCLRFQNFLFLGDAVYPTEKKGRECYNVQQLNQEIQTLKNEDCEHFCISHAKYFVKTKESVIKHLEEIYAKKIGNAPWIFL